jgi:hypothetical protein
MFITGVNDTGDKLFSGVNDTGAASTVQQHTYALDIPVSMSLGYALSILVFLIILYHSMFKTMFVSLVLKLFCSWSHGEEGESCVGLFYCEYSIRSYLLLPQPAEMRGLKGAAIYSICNVEFYGGCIKKVLARSGTCQCNDRVSFPW